MGLWLRGLRGWDVLADSGGWVGGRVGWGDTGYVDVWTEMGFDVGLVVMLLDDLRARRVCALGFVWVEGRYSGLLGV